MTAFAIVARASGDKALRASAVICDSPGILLWGSENDFDDFIGGWRGTEVVTHGSTTEFVSRIISVDGRFSGVEDAMIVFSHEISIV
jgi:hypothetical protein